MPLSKEEYLRRMYLDPVGEQGEGSSKKKRKKKRKKNVAVVSGLKVVDEDLIVEGPGDENRATALTHSVESASLDSDSDSDVPVKRKRNRRASPSDSDSDPPIPRRTRSTGGDSDDSDSDVPVRRRGRARGSSDESGDEVSGGRKRRRMDSSDSDSDSRPKRRRRMDSSDEGDGIVAESGRAGVIAESAASGGLLVGLHTGRDVRLQAEMKKRAEEEQYKKMSTEDLGKDAEVVHRDRHGRRLETLEAFQRQQRGEVVSARERMEWGTGKVQLDHAKSRHEDMAREAKKPLARYIDDEDLNDMYKEQDRWGDPMMGMVSKKSKKKKKSDAPQRPVYQGTAPPNRFGIRPGHRWDGVDRGNGWENKMFKALSNRKAQQQDAYKWAVEDM